MLTEVKRCSDCRVEHDLRDGFSKNNRRADGRQNICRGCQAIRRKKNRKAHPERIPHEQRWFKAWVTANYDWWKVAERLCRYHLTLDEYHSILERQDFLCAICQIERVDQCPHVDHNHYTGKVRGFLCGGCNSGLGHFGDDANRLLLGYEYLQKRGSYSERSRDVNGG